MIATLITRDAPAQSGLDTYLTGSSADEAKKVGTPADTQSLNRVIVSLRYTREKVTNGAPEPYDMSSSGATADRSD